MFWIIINIDVPERFKELNYDKDIDDILINYLSNINSGFIRSNKLNY